MDEKCPKKVSRCWLQFFRCIVQCCFQFFSLLADWSGNVLRGNWEAGRVRRVAEGSWSFFTTPVCQSHCSHSFSHLHVLRVLRSSFLVTE